MEQKKVEQIAAEKYPLHNAIDRDAQYTRQRAYIAGHIDAQQSQPMWRQIEGDKEYNDVIVKTEEDRIEQFTELHGQVLRAHGYTHYLSSDDLLKLPTEKK